MFRGLFKFITVATVAGVIAHLVDDHIDDVIDVAAESNRIKKEELNIKKKELESKEKD